jgi:hypothetical protein
VSDRLLVPVFLSVNEITQIERVLLHQPAISLDASRRLGGLLARLGLAREEIMSVEIARHAPTATMF